MIVSFYTTVLRPDEKLRRTHESLARSGVAWEHVVTVAKEFDKVFDFLPREAANLTVLSTPGAGISEGFNAAIQQCRGQYLMAVNAGDLVLDVRPLAAALDQASDVEAAYGDIRFDGQLRKARPGPLTKWDWIKHAMCFCHGAAMTRREFHERYGFYEDQYRATMDFALYLGAVCSGARMVHVPHVVAEIEGGGASSHTLARTRENYRIIRQYVSWLVAFPIACKWMLASWLAEIRERRAKSAAPLNA